MSHLDLSDAPKRIGHSVYTRASWLMRAKPDDYLIAAGAASSHLPVIGRHLEPVGGLTALGIWAARYLPDMMASAKRSRRAGVQRADTTALADLVTAGLRDTVSVEALARPCAITDGGAPWRTATRQRRLVHRASVPYGDEPG